MLTQFQKDELLHYIDVRQTTIKEDPTSAWGIEQVSYGLKVLEEKVQDDFFQPPNKMEKQWMKYSIQERIDILLENIQGSTDSDILNIKKDIKELRKLLVKFKSI